MEHLLVAQCANVQMASAGRSNMSYSEQELNERIRVRAYLMWEADGRPHGQAELYWHRARERIEDETCSAYPPTQSGEHRS
jgi:hypothetical protein